MVFKNRIPRGISGENVSGCQVFPRYRSGKKREEDFVADDGCEYSSSCLQCPLPACKYDDPVGAFFWMMRGRTGGSQERIRADGGSA